MSNWIQFFRAAGIPPGPATTYATLFTDNRIQKSMLLDLTKEYLKDMGILVLGDIIAILKYAKTAHSEYEREKPAMSALSLKADEKVELKRQRTPGSRMLEHYMRREGVIEEDEQKVKVSPSMAVRLGAVPSPGLNKKHPAVVKSAEVIPVKKARRVDPAEEGHYVINMPKGTTPKTQKILQKGKPEVSKSSVFDRLGGGGNVTTAVAAAPAASPEDASSVFKRLGGLQRQRTASEKSNVSILEYKGVLKSDKPAYTTEKTLTVKIPAIFQDRLGVQKPEVSTTSATMDKDLRQQKIQVRLGPPKAAGGFQKTIRTKNVVAMQNFKGGKNPSGLKKTITTGGGGTFIQTVKPILHPSAVKRSRVQHQKVTPEEPKVTITMGGAKPTANIHSRLGVNAAPNPANRSALGGGGTMISTKKAQKRPAVTMVSDIPQKKVNLKDRLGVQKVEASSTTPAFTVKLGGLQGASSKKGMQSGRKRGGMSGRGGNVFSRLGST